MDQEIRQLSEEITRQFRRNGGDPDVKTWANNTLESIQTDFERIRHTNGYQDFILEYLSGEIERFHADDKTDLENTPYEEPRTTQLCTCNTGECPLKQGRIPREIKHANSFTSGLREFTQHHQGDPIVLTEAKTLYFETITQVKSTLRTVVTALTNNRLPSDLESSDVSEA
jgi:hypothetical protein